MTLRGLRLLFIQPTEESISHPRSFQTEQQELQTVSHQEQPLTLRLFQVLGFVYPITDM